MDRGVTVIERETFESALLLGRRVLQQLGFGAWRARQAAMKFRDHNLKSLLAVYPYYRDQKQFVSMSKQARDELEEMFARDLEAGKSAREDGWD
jgi:glutathione-regulated potassium-efflux system ancillary protein KefC